MSLKVGLVGCGAIGLEIARYLDRCEIPAELAAIYDTKRDRMRTLVGELKRPPLESESLGELVSLSELVVEAASQKAVPGVAESALGHGRDLMILSVGALMDLRLYEKIQDLARYNRCRVYIPTGAITGLDGIKSAGIGKINSITLTTTKPPAGLEGAPYVVAHQINLRGLKEPTLIFEGPASAAVKEFPANVNVAASLSLASGIDVLVRIVADPGIDVNIHDIALDGEFGRMTTRVENVPSPTNPRTSYLAALSAIATLRTAVLAVRIGT